MVVPHVSLAACHMPPAVPGASRALTAKAASFLVMWSVMTAAMMLPSLALMLARYRRAMPGRSARSLNVLTVAAACGYFTAWIGLGAAVFAATAALRSIGQQQPWAALLLPSAAALAIVAAGALQFTPWKARQLACCGDAGRADGGGPGAGWRYGVQRGIDCARCCGNLMAIPLVLGSMDWRLMAAVTAAITIERLPAFDARVARATGIAVAAAGFYLWARA